MTAELHRLAIEGLNAEIPLFGGCADACSIIRRDGVVASLSPPTPDRSIFNSVFATGPSALEAALDELAGIYAEAGVRAWTVWVPDYDRTSAGLLESRGHVLDGAPRAMGLDLGDLRPPARRLPAGVELVPGEITAIAAINDLAYGLEREAWSEALIRAPDELPYESLVAVVEEQPVACAIVLDHGDDAVVSAVGTVPEHRGKGLAGCIITELLESARARGQTTGSLQASRAGAPVYERLGFADVGFLELWERRTV